MLEEATTGLLPQLCGDHLALWLMATALSAVGGDGDSLLEAILWGHQVVSEVATGDEEEVGDQIGEKMLRSTDSRESL